MGTLALNSRLVERSIKAAGWGLSGSALRIVLQMGAQIVLARILGPEQYGLFAIGVLVVSLANYVADSGIAYGLVQRKDITDADIRFVFTWQAILGLLVALAIIALAPLLAGVFHEPRADNLLKALSLVCLVNALTTPSMNLLKRALDHRNLQIGQVIAYAVGYVGIGIPLAIHGVGVWALVYAWLTVAIVQWLYLYNCVRHPLRPLLWFEYAKSHLNFGGLVLLTNLVNWFMTNVDKAIAARFFPGANLGLYSTSFTLLNTPTTVVYSNVQSVVFAASAQVQGQTDSMKRAYLKLLGLLSGIFLPAFGALAAVAGTLMLALYGSAWAAAAPMVTAFACGMPLLLVWGISTPVLWNTGQAFREIRIQVPIAILWVAGAYYAVQFSVVVLAWAMTACFLIRVVMVVAVVCRTLQIRLVETARAILGPVVVALLVTGGVAGIDRLLIAEGWHALAVLGADVVAGAIGLVVAMRYLSWALSPLARDLLGEASRKMPALIRPTLTSIARGPQ